jgi:hypothetical protein
MPDDVIPRMFAGREPGRDGPDILPIQPHPLCTDVAHARAAAGPVTAIMRDWRPGDAARCRLCPRARCSAAGRDHCLVVVNLYVPHDAAPLYSTRGLPGAAAR